MPDKIVTLKISGRVQGVGYRQWMVEEAFARRLRGWVRNRREGWVEALVAGPAELVDGMIAACHVGPPMARVENVEVEAPDSAASTALDHSTRFVARGTY